MRVAFAFLVATLLCPRGASAQARAGEDRSVSGRVVLGTRKARIPLANQWVTLHEIDSVHAGPLDSARTSAAGTFSFRYRTSGNPGAAYILSSVRGGIAYFLPLTQKTVRGDDGELAVFDTSSAHDILKTAGRHFVLFGAQQGGRRPVGEVFELNNDSTVTVVAADTVPVWRSALPPGVDSVDLDPKGDVNPAVVLSNNGAVRLYAAIGPGLRQIAYTYTLPQERFPLSIPLERPTELLEVLVQERNAVVAGAGLTEVAPTAEQGVMLRRFLAKDVPASAVITINVPAPAGSFTRAIGIIAAVIAGAAGLALVGVFAQRSRTRRVIGVSPAEAAIRELATLDAAFERVRTPTDEARADYLRRREELKARARGAIGSPTLATTTGAE